jgi:membrane protease YdiL (CAAX protease family)
MLRVGLTPGMASLVLALLFVVAGILLSLRDLKGGRTRFRPALIPWIWCEGVTWGLVLHLAWNGLDGGLADGGGLGPMDNLALALGAGVYEELVFRVAVFWLVLKLLELMSKPETREAGRMPRVIGSVLITSFVFALAHHLGPEPFHLGAMLFRTTAALLFTTLFAWRGLGVAVCAHAAYDVFVVAL